MGDADVKHLNGEHGEFFMDKREMILNVENQMRKRKCESYCKKQINR